jgi:flagellar motor switch protein FliN/FliY
MNETRKSSDVSVNVERILNIRLSVVVQMAERRISLSEIMDMRIGALIEFDRLADRPLDVHVNHKKIGTGTAVTVGEKFGVQITSVERMEELIRALGR